MIEIGPREGAERACVVLHGLGASGADLAPLAPALWPDPSVRWLFPDAPERPVTINGGMRTRAWYDVRAMDLTREEDEDGVRESAATVDGIIEKVVGEGVPRGRIALAGFSQGGAMALFAGLRQPEPLLAVVGLSCYLPLPGTLAGEIGEGAKSTPVFLGCGAMDPVIPAMQTEAAAETLRGHGLGVDLHVYPHLAHGIEPAEVGEVAEFLISKKAR